MSEEEKAKFFADIFLLTIKPVIYVCNVDEKSVITGNKHTEALREAVKGENAEILMISAAIESEIAVFLYMDSSPTASEPKPFIVLSNFHNPM